MVLNISPAAPAAVTKFSILGPACPRENAAMMTAKNTANMSPGNKMFSEIRNAPNLPGRILEGEQ